MQIVGLFGKLFLFLLLSKNSFAYPHLQNEIPEQLKFKVRKEAKSKAIRDAKSDSAAVTLHIGVKQGQLDGERDGRERGLETSKINSYKLGLERGEQAGKVLAEIEGTKVGSEAGLLASIEELAIKDAERQAEFDIENSNVKVMAAKKGHILGKDKARNDGYKIGRAKGEANAIDKFENRSLSPIHVDGPFIGTFSPRTPDFDETVCEKIVCASYKNTLENIHKTYIDHNLNLLFKVIYKDEFLKALRVEFLENISSLYLSSYTTQFNASLEHYSKEFNQKSYDRGLKESSERAKNSYRKLYEESAKKLSFDNALMKNHTKSAAYKKMYKKHYKKFKLKFWNREFDSISEKAEREAYDANIDTEIIKAKTIRYSEVSKFYESSPVLSFKYGKMKSIGLSGTGADDGVFQPGENLAHDIIIINYGLAAAKDIIIVTDNHLKFKVDHIPASTEMHLKGVAKSVIPENLIDGFYSPTLEVYYQSPIDNPLSKNHYEDYSKALLGGKVHSPLEVKYPLHFAVERWDNSFIHQQEKEVTILLKNNSKKPLIGNYTLSFESNSEQKFDNRSLTLNLAPGATYQYKIPLDFENNKDLYQDIFVQGVLKSDQVNLAKAKKENVLVKSKNDLAELQQMQTIFLAGGTRPQPIISQLLTNTKKSFSVLDLSIAKASDKKPALKNKSFILVHEQEGDLNVELLSKIIKKNSNLLVIKNSQTEVKIPNTSLFKLQLEMFEDNTLTIAPFKTDEGLLPILIVNPEIAKKSVYLSQYLARDHGKTTYSQIKNTHDGIESYALKLFFMLIESPTKENLNKIVANSNESLKVISKKALNNALSSLDLESLSKVYSKLKDEIQNDITLKIQMETDTLPESL